MKHFRYKILNLLLAGAVLFSCEKEEDRVTLTGGADPELMVSATSDLVLTKAKENYGSLQFQWTNPDYQFSNGTNTQDVYYTLEIDTTGSSFTNPKKSTLAFTKEEFKEFKVKDLNNALSAMELKDFTPHDFEFRIKAAMSNSSAVKYSNVIKIKITTYLDVVYPVPDELYITGDATPGNWMGDGNAPLLTQKFEKINAYTFQLANLHMAGDLGFLFVPVYGNWSNKYGFTGEGKKNNTNGDTFKPSGNDLLSPPTGNYKITVNFKTGKYSFDIIK
jgi:hypothetical protein